MCLYPKLIKNKKYTKNKKNGGVIPAVSDNRVLWVTAACGKCFECRKQKARAWQVRMSEELRENPNAIFVTLTISDESFEYIMDKYQIETNEECCKKMVRLFLERIRKETKKSIKHWFITEMGHKNTERYHLHGIMWGIGIDEIVKKNWKYGFVFIGSFVNEQTINYVVKYMLKKDKDHKEYNPTILCSAGIGAGYLNRKDSELNKYYGGDLKAKDFSLTNLEGKTVKLSDYKGKIVVLDFWATWCGPCRESLPHMQELVNQYKGKDVEFFFVNTMENYIYNLLKKNNISDNLYHKLSEIYQSKNLPTQEIETLRTENKKIATKKAQQELYKYYGGDLKAKDFQK